MQFLKSWKWFYFIFLFWEKALLEIALFLILNANVLHVQYINLQFWTCVALPPDLSAMMIAIKRMPLASFAVSPSSMPCRVTWGMICHTQSKAGHGPKIHVPFSFCASPLSLPNLHPSCFALWICVEDTKRTFNLNKSTSKNHFKFRITFYALWLCYPLHPSRNLPAAPDDVASCFPGCAVRTHALLVHLPFRFSRCSMQDMLTQ